MHRHLRLPGDVGNVDELDPYEPPLGYSAGAYAHDVHAHRCEAPLDGRKPRGPESLGFGRRDLLDGVSGAEESLVLTSTTKGVTLARQDVHPQPASFRFLPRI